MPDNAGCIWNEGKLTIKGGRFLDNSALDGVGGAIRCSPVPKASPNPELYIRETKIAGNYASIDGGAIYCYKTDTTLVKPKKEKGECIYYGK